MVELYIEGKKIDLKEDIQIDFSYETVDPEKLASIKNSFSKTVEVPGTPNNNITFGHIFRMDKYISVVGPSNIDNWYDPHRRANFILNKNGAMAQRGYCTLDNIVIKSPRDITYKLTLYGGIGEFFYQLSYNENNEAKTLKDIFFNWRPKKSLSTYGSPMNETEEASQTLMKCSAQIVTNAWHTLKPSYTYEGTTDIDKDVVFVPCYSGTYENFDSKHMLVNTYNNTHYTGYMPAADAARLANAFPLLKTDYSDDPDNPTNYYAIGSTLSQSDTYRYGLVTFSRDLDPWEAGDIRVNEMPVAIRLSKLLWAISNSTDYEVTWDQEILNSYYWLYSWVVLGKMNKELDSPADINFEPNISYDGQQTILENRVDASSGELGLQEVSSATTYTLVQSSSSLVPGRYTMNINVYPKWEFTIRKYDVGWNWYTYYGFPFISGRMYVKKSGNTYKNGDFTWVTPILIHRVYGNGTLQKIICDIFYYSSDVADWKFGSNPKVPIPDIKSQLESYIQANLTNAGETISEFTYHNCNASNYSETEIEDYGNFYSFVSIDMNRENISTTFNVSSNLNINVTQSQYVIGTNCSFEIENGNTTVTYRVDAFNPQEPLEYTPFGFVEHDYDTAWPRIGVSSDKFYYSYSLANSAPNGFFANQISGFNILELDKSTLFANSESPMKYLTDFCKALNLRFICDNISKKIEIKTLENYYKDASDVYDINDKVDIGRQIDVKPVVTSYKRINIGLDTPDTYPVSLFNRKSKDKFNTFKFDTNIEYNTTEQNLLNNLVYKNTIDWQQSSVFYQIHNQFPRAYNTPTISWTLWDTSEISSDNLKSKEFITTGASTTSSNLLATTDFMPKQALFNESDKLVDSFPTLVFLNGFIKNYDYVKTADAGTASTISPNSINGSHFINYAEEIRTSSYQDIYIYDVTESDINSNYYYVTCSFGSGYGSYVANYMNANNVRIGYEYSQSNSTYTDALLHIPSGTRHIWINFRKQDTDKKLTKASRETYTIAPRVMFSNDTVEQFYLNGGRCYINDFKFNDIFATWGCYSTASSAYSTSYTLPFFSKDLYNEYVYDMQTWDSIDYKLASWNLVGQEGLDTMYDLTNTEFVGKPDATFSQQVHTEPQSYNYFFDSFPVDLEDETRIYDARWKGYMNDLYSRNTRDVTLYVDLTELSDPNEIMRKMYSWNGHLWIITKMHNYRVANIVNDRFTKVTMHKVTDLSPYTNG